MKEWIGSDFGFTTTLEHHDLKIVVFLNKVNPVGLAGIFDTLPLVHTGGRELAMDCKKLGIHHHGLETDNYEKAQAKALEIVGARIKEFSDVFDYMNREVDNERHPIIKISESTEVAFDKCMSEAELVRGRKNELTNKRGEVLKVTFRMNPSDVLEVDDDINTIACKFLLRKNK